MVRGYMTSVLFCFVCLFDRRVLIVVCSGCADLFFDGERDKFVCPRLIACIIGVGHLWMNMLKKMPRFRFALVFGLAYN